MEPETDMPGTTKPSAPAANPGLPFLTADPTWGITYTNAQGAASVQIPIPSNPALQGAVVFGQWGAINPSNGLLTVLSGGRDLHHPVIAVRQQSVDMLFRCSSE